MSTPEAMEEADYIRRCCCHLRGERFEAEVFNAFVAVRLDRFAAQRGAEADQARLRLFEADRRRDGYIIPEGAPPQTGCGDAGERARVWCSPEEARRHGECVHGRHLCPECDADYVAATKTGIGVEKTADKIVAQMKGTYFATPTEMYAAWEAKITAALRSSHREGAEAMREADDAELLKLLKEAFEQRGHDARHKALSDAAAALRAIPIPGKTE